MNKKIAFLGALILSANSVASTQDNPWYAGARIGATHYSDFADNLFSDDKIDDNNIAGGLFLGYNISDWFALEAGYTYLGELEIEDQASITNQAVELVGKFTWQATDTFDVFAKAGAFHYKTKGDDQLSGHKERDTDGTLGLGIEYHFTHDLAARVEYQFYHNMTLNDGNYRSEWDTHLLALGLVYSWGGSEKIEVVDAPAPIVVEEIIEPVVVEPVEEKVIEAVVVEEVITEVEENKSLEVTYKTVEVYFDTASERLSDVAIKELQPLIQHLKEFPQAVIFVVGHTDSRGAAKNNQRLSEKRAKTISNYLIKEFSIDSERVTVSGEGEANPIATNETKEGQAKNRRVSVFSPSFIVEK